MLEPKKINPENYYRGSLEKQKADILSNFCFEQVAMINGYSLLPIILILLAFSIPLFIHPKTYCESDTTVMESKSELTACKA